MNGWNQHRVDKREKTGGQPGDFSANNNQRALDAATSRDAEKCFPTWQAKYAMFGHALYRTASPDGAVLYLASCWGMVREMKSLEAVAKFYEVIGGKV